MEKAGLLLIMATVLMVFGCPQQEEQYKYSVDSLAIEGQEHIYSKNYSIYVRLSEDAFSSGQALVLYQDSARIAEKKLDYTDVPDKKQLIFFWHAEATGNYTLSAVVENENQTAVSNSKQLSVSVKPLGNYGFESPETNYPVENQVYCAQKFSLENEATPGEVQLQLRSLVPTREGKKVIIEIRESAGSQPSEEAPLQSAAIYSSQVIQESEWHTFALKGEKLSPGEYWVVLYRDDVVGNVGWTYSDGSGGICRDLEVSEDWIQIEGEFAFRIQ
ncbi:hypothetical protein GF415_03390 [Candidatus Micrarchaeota archaeon]|nr:hypothetical protein [Candidatus Micrarchaeota archaeon]